MLKKIKNYLFITLAVILTIIAMANLHPVTIKLLIFSFEIPLIVLFFILLIIGFSAGYLTKGIVNYRKNR